jgi:hypothetical protein
MRDTDRSTFRRILWPCSVRRELLGRCNLMKLAAYLWVVSDSVGITGKEVTGDFEIGVETLAHKNSGRTRIDSCFPCCCIMYASCIGDSEGPERPVLLMASSLLFLSRWQKHHPSSREVYSDIKTLQQHRRRCCLHDLLLSKSLCFRFSDFSRNLVLWVV